MDIVTIAKNLKLTIEELEIHINKIVKCWNYSEAFIYDSEFPSKKRVFEVMMKWISQYRYRIQVIYRIFQIIMGKEFIYSKRVYLLKQKRLLRNKQEQMGFLIFLKNLYITFLIKRYQCNVKYYGLLFSCIEQHLIFKYTFHVSPFIDIPKCFWEGTYKMLEITAGTIIGRGVRITSCVTFAPDPQRGAPVIRDNVNIFRGAMVYGNVTIGDGATVGSNSAVFEDVPPGATVLGVPAKVIFQKKTR